MNLFLDLFLYAGGWLLSIFIGVIAFHLYNDEENQTLSRLFLALTFHFAILSGMPLLSYLEAYDIKKLWEYIMTISLYYVLYTIYKYWRSIINSN